MLRAHCKSFVYGGSIFEDIRDFDGTKKANRIKDMIIKTQGPVSLKIGPRNWLLKCGQNISFGRELEYNGKVMVAMKEGRFHDGKFSGYARKFDLVN